MQHGLHAKRWVLFISKAPERLLFFVSGRRVFRDTPGASWQQKGSARSLSLRVAICWEDSPKCCCVRTRASFPGALPSSCLRGGKFRLWSGSPRGCGGAVGGKALSQSWSPRSKKLEAGLPRTGRLLQVGLERQAVLPPGRLLTAVSDRDGQVEAGRQDRCCLERKHSLCARCRGAAGLGWAAVLSLCRQLCFLVAATPSTLHLSGAGQPRAPGDKAASLASP